MAVRKTKKGADLRRWFKEKWIDVRTGKPCGRTAGEKRGTPYCRPSKEFQVKRLRQQVKCPLLKRKRKLKKRKV